MAVPSVVAGCRSLDWNPRPGGTEAARRLRLTLAARASGPPRAEPRAGRSDVRIRRNIALFLNAATGNWYERTRPRLDIRGCLPALVAALADSDARVRALAAQAVGAVGPEASLVVPALVALLESGDEESRNSACIGLTGIGPSAREALPALRKALSDSRPDVRHFAQRAIDAIER